MGKEVPVFGQWKDFLLWLLPTTGKFPKTVRFTLVQRIDNLALDIVEDLVEARYSKQKEAPLAQINLRLEKLRILLQLSYELRHLPARQYEHAMKVLYDIGQSIGGWRKSQAAR